MRSRLRRLLVYVTTLLAFVSASTAAQVHETVVLHVACAEHGVEEDLPAPTVHAAPESKPHFHKAPAEQADHVACALPAALAAGALQLPSPGWTLVPPPPVDETVAQPEGVPGRTGPPLYHLAPKNSPPADRSSLT